MTLKAGQQNRQKMINLMYIVFIALMGLGIQEELEPNTSPQAVESSPSPTPRKGENTTSSSHESPITEAQFVARAIPRSRSVIQGTNYEAELRLVAANEYQHKRIVVAGQALPTESHSYRAVAQRLGEHRYSGYIEWEDALGNLRQAPFEERYEVIEPSIAIAPSLMQVLYAGIDNKLSISASGIARERLQVRAEGGSIRNEGGQFVVKPSIQEGLLKLHLSTDIGEGKQLALGTHALRVRPLPPPLPYLTIRNAEGGTGRWRGGRISKQQLRSVSGLSAAVDDGILDIDFTVQSFQIISFDGLGNAIPEVSSAAMFSARQREQIEQSPRGKRLYITEIIARGPDGVQHRLPPLELILQ